MSEQATLDLALPICFQLAVINSATQVIGLSQELSDLRKKLIKDGEDQALKALSKMIIKETGGNEHQLHQVLKKTYQNSLNLCGKGKIALLDVWLEETPSPGAKPFTAALDNKLFWVRSTREHFAFSADHLLAAHQASKGIEQYGALLAYKEVQFLDLTSNNKRQVPMELLISHIERETEQSPGRLDWLKAELKLCSPEKPDPVTALHVINAHTKAIRHAIEAGKPIIPLLTQQERLYRLKQVAIECLYEQGRLEYAGVDQETPFSPHLLVGHTPFGEKGFHSKLPDPGKPERRPTRPGEKGEAETIARHFPLVHCVHVLETELKKHGKMPQHPEWQGVLHGYKPYS